MKHIPGFRAVCGKCGAMLRSQQRLCNHRVNRCNARNWPRKPASILAHDTDGKHTPRKPRSEAAA